MSSLSSLNLGNDYKKITSYQSKSKSENFFTLNRINQNSEVEYIYLEQNFGPGAWSIPVYMRL